MKGNYVVAILLGAVLGIAVLLHQASKVENPLKELANITYPSVVLFYYGKKPNPTKELYYKKYDEMEKEYAMEGRTKIKFIKINRLHKKLAVQLGVDVYPTLMGFDETGEEIGRVEYDEDESQEEQLKQLKIFNDHIWAK